MHFRRISVKIQPKNLKLVYYQFLAVQGNIRLEGTPRALLGPSLVTPSVCSLSPKLPVTTIAPFCPNPYQIQS